MSTDAQLSQLSLDVAEQLRKYQRKLVTAESCTGGWIGKLLTDVPGSSAWYLGGVVSYSNALKMSLLDVRSGTLGQHGAVSAQTAREMAAGALGRLGGTCALSVTGIAGPDGGSAEKPVGLVWFGWAVRSGIDPIVEVASERFPGNREDVRRAAVARALRGVIELVQRHP